MTMQKEAVLEKLQQPAIKSLIATQDTVIFHDWDSIKNRLDTIQSSFPSQSFHTVAIKAMQAPEILEEIVNQGFGLEAASQGEIDIALKSGCPTDKIIFDSPVKTKQEIANALKMGIHINIDSFSELEYHLQIRQNLALENRPHIGFRINPQVGKGNIKSTSVADTFSKFGIPLDEAFEQLIAAYNKHSFLDTIHFHVGSQGCAPELLWKATAKAADFIREYEKRHPSNRHQIKNINIGGGLPVQYKADDPKYDMASYAEGIEKILAEKQLGHLKLMTEFGRYVHANAGFVISKVEHIKQVNHQTIALIHVGADLFVRRCYNPDDWHHDMVILNQNLETKPAPIAKIAIAGPLCFAGDMITRNINLPKPDQGDYVLIFDTGAYTASMWSIYNSRAFPKLVLLNSRATSNNNSSPNKIILRPLI